MDFLGDKKLKLSRSKTTRETDIVRKSNLKDVNGVSLKDHVLSSELGVMAAATPDNIRKLKREKEERDRAKRHEHDEKIRRRTLREVKEFNWDTEKGARDEDLRRAREAGRERRSNDSEDDSDSKCCIVRDGCFLGGNLKATNNLTAQVR